MKLPQANWKNLISTDNEEEEVEDLIEVNLLMQDTNFSTRLKNILDLAPYESCHIHAENIETVEKIYNCSDHTPIMMTV